MSHDHNHKSNNIRIAFFLNLFFAILQVFVGLYTNSISILSNSLHDFGDSLSIGLSWYLDKLSDKKRTEKFSYGYKRFSVLAAMINSLVLLTGSFFIISEAVSRIIKPEHSNVKGMLLFAILGIAINTVAALRLIKSKKISEKTVSWHLVDDILGWIAVLIVSLVTMIRDIHILDPILSILITLFILWNVFKNLRTVLMIFLQGVPGNINQEKLENAILKLPNVKAIHDTHIWSLDGEHNILTTHLVFEHNAKENDMNDAKCRAKEIINKFNVGHSTIEIEKEEELCDLNKC